MSTAVLGTRETEFSILKLDNIGVKDDKIGVNKDDNLTKLQSKIATLKSKMTV